MAVITGMFPVLDQPLVLGSDGNVGYYKKLGDTFSFTSFNSVNNWGEADVFMENVRNLLNDSTNYSTADYYDWSHVGPWAVKQSGIPSATPPDRILYGDVIRVNNKPFRKRVLAGEMVVTDYRRINAHLTYRNGGRRTILGPPTLYDRYWQVLQSIGYPEVNWLSPAGWSNNRARAPSSSAPLAVGQYTGGGTSPVIRQYYQKVSLSDNLTAYNCGWDDQVIQDFLNLKVSDYVPEDTLNDVVTSTMSEANKSTVDILTALAEAPETVKSISDLVLQVIKLTAQMRKRHFSILTKAKRVQRLHEERIFRVNYESRAKWLAARNNRTRKIIENERQRNVAQLRLDLANTLADAASAVSQVWLSYRYAIMPNVYLVEDLYKSLTKALPEFERWGQRRTIRIPPPEMTGWDVDGDITVTARCFVKRKFDPAKINLQDKEFSANVAVTLWELVPLSFVVDWALNIGDCLSFLFGHTSGYEEAVAISAKLEKSLVTYTHSSGATVSVDFRGYSRKKINPWHYCALRWDPFIDLTRQLDAASLSYQILIKDALKGLINRK